jgi:hypothetical protein
MLDINDPLWVNIKDFQFDKEDDEFTYARKLSFENNWKYEFTQKVVTEYKKLLYLCALSEQPLSPSPLVDKAWHLHLSYTKSYWEDLCKGILGKHLHHEPSKGKEGEMEYYDNLYKDTLSYYEKIYGTKPPSEIWPSSMEEFRKSKKFSLKKIISTAKDDKYSLLKLFSIAVLLLVITFFSYVIINGAPQGSEISKDEITKTENVSGSPDLMEIIEKNPKKILFGIFVSSFLVFYLFFKSYSGGGGGGYGTGGGEFGVGGCAASCGSGGGCGGGCGGGVESVHIAILFVPIYSFFQSLLNWHEAYS